MEFRKYNIFLSVGIIATLSGVSIINFVVDPGEIYLRRMVSKKFVSRYVNTMLKSPYGMTQTGWNERDVKLALVKHADKHDCILIGSSHIMSISKANPIGLDIPLCKKVLNLGVSGGGFEDMLIFLYETMRTNSTGHVFLAIDPWLFNLNKDARWAKHAEVYFKALKFFGIAMPEDAYKIDHREKIIKNLINKQYFVRSIRYLLKYGVVKLFQDYRGYIKYDELVVGKFDFSIGTERAVTLFDGSHVYSKKYISAPRPKSKFNDTGYKIDLADLIDNNVVAVLAKVIKKAKKSGLKISFLVTPYHHFVWDDKAAPSRTAMKKVNSVVQKLAQEHDVDIYGSYNPYALKCNINQFYDFMHPDTSCVNTIFKYKNIQQK